MTNTPSQAGQRAFRPVVFAGTRMCLPHAGQPTMTVFWLAVAGRDSCLGIPGLGYAGAAMLARPSVAGMMKDLLHLGHLALCPAKEARSPSFAPHSHLTVIRSDCVSSIVQRPPGSEKPRKSSSAAIGCKTRPRPIWPRLLAHAATRPHVERLPQALHGIC